MNIRGQPGSSTRGLKGGKNIKRRRLIEFTMKGGKSKSDVKNTKLSVTKKPAKPTKKAGKAAKDPNKPKRPPSAFFVFM
ncbi:unnamed protein product [Linum tenue]|nr:unnamed protein product [Linum tenue]